MIRKRLFILFAVFFFSVSLVSGLFINTPPAQAAENEGLVIEAEWIDRANIKITKMEFTGNSTLREEYKNSMAEINTKLASAIGAWTDKVVDDDEQQFLRDVDGCSGDKASNVQVANAHRANKFNPAESKLSINNNNLTIKMNGVCENVMAGIAPTVSRSLAFDVGEPEKRFIWFRGAADGNITRVDGKWGAMAKDEAAGNTFGKYVPTGDAGCGARVELKEAPKTGVGEVTDAWHETCLGQNPFSDADPAKVVFTPDPDDPDTPANPDGENSPTCESTGWLTWIVCPVINGLAEVADGAFEHFIEPMLSTPAVDIVNTDNPIFKVWVAMRNIANILLVVAMIVIVFGQAIGGGLVDAYTAKKVLPRILAAAIMVNLSIYIVAFAVDITNVIGQGITQLLYFPFQSVDAFKFNISQGTAGLGIVGLVGAGGGIWLAAAAGTAFIPWLLLFVLLPLAIAMLGVLFTLVLRQGIIQFLIISSPVAFVLYCLPNTEQYFKKWWSLFLKTLLVYPIIMLIFALADILAVTTDLAAANDPGATQLPAQIISIVLLVLPLFMIPYAFKLAGGAIGAIHGVLTSSGKKGVNAIKGSETDPNSMRNSTKRRAREGRDAKLDRMLRGGKGPDATRRQRVAGHLADRLGGNINGRMAEHTLRAQEREEMESKTGYDGYRYAANWFSHEDGEALPTGLKGFDGNSLDGQTAQGRMFFDSKGRQITQQMASYSQRKHARSEHEVGRNLEYAMRKAKTDDDQANVRRAFRAAALRSGYTGKEIQDQHNRSFFEHKGEFGATYFSTPYGIDAAGNRIDRTDTTTKAVDIGWDDVADGTAEGNRNQNTHVEEVHKARGQYDYSRMRDEDWRSWDTRRNRIQDELDAGQTITDQDAKFYAETNEILDAVTHTPVMMPGGAGDAQTSVTGVSAASQGVIKAMQDNRRYETTAAPAGTTLAGGHTISSVNERVIYNKDQAARLTSAPGGVGPVLSKEAAILAATRAATEVTGDADRTRGRA